MKSILVVLVMLVAFTGCVKKNKVPTAQDVNNPAMHEVKVEEVIQTSGYTYMRVKENDAEKWIAVNRQEAAAGEVYYYEQGLEMQNFNSKELNRTFETVYFVSGLSKEPIAAHDHDHAHGAHGAEGTENIKPVQPTLTQKEGIAVEPAVEGLTIAKLYADRAKYDGKTIKMSGQVVKINDEVMGKNWIHIQDGTSEGSNFDLTITSNDMVKVDDVVTFEGAISLKKDFGHGYFYEVIMEDAKLVK